MLEIPGFSDTDTAHVYKLMSDIIPEKQYLYLERCLAWAPHRREPYYYLAQYFANLQDWDKATYYIKQALEHTVPSLDVLNNKDVWIGGVEKLQAKIEECYNSNEQRIKE